MCPVSEPDFPHATQVLETSSSTETEAFAAELATGLTAGDLVLLEGEMGTGKTTFVRGLARALGVTDPVNSPTFSIGHRYRGGRTAISHLDLSRIVTLDEEDPSLLEDYLTGQEIAVIEWPQVAGELLSEPRLTVKLTHRGGDRRRIEVTGR
jgi:tRNA threonylcarbamoyladenosine biosynthesis protein TsaE